VALRAVRSQPDRKVWTLQQPAASGRRVFSWADAGTTAVAQAAVRFLYLVCSRRGSRRLALKLRCERLLEAPPMLIPALTFRRCLMLGLMLAGLISLADGVARHELQRATSEMAFAVAADE
jgi:hypothetical protein